jgi:hypothetical protein
MPNKVCDERVPTARWQEFAERSTTKKHLQNAKTLLDMRCGDCDSTRSMLPTMMLPELTQESFMVHVKPVLLRQFKAATELSERLERVTPCVNLLLACMDSSIDMVEALAAVEARCDAPNGSNDRPSSESKLTTGERVLVPTAGTNIAIEQEQQLQGGRGAATNKYKSGDAVKARYMFRDGTTTTSFFGGTVESINADGTYVIMFDDGDRDEKVPEGNVQVPEGNVQLLRQRSVGLDEWPPLVAACFFDQPAAVCTLLQAGDLRGGVSIPGTNITVLDLACRNGSIDCVKALLGADHICKRELLEAIEPPLQEADIDSTSPRRLLAVQYLDAYDAGKKAQINAAIDEARLEVEEEGELEEAMAKVRELKGGWLVQKERQHQAAARQAERQSDQQSKESERMQQQMRLLREQAEGELRKGMQRRQQRHGQDEDGRSREQERQRDTWYRGRLKKISSAEEKQRTQQQREHRLQVLTDIIEKRGELGRERQ